MTLDEQQEDEYTNRVYSWHVDVSNNIGIATKFLGSESEFDKKYKKYFESDTYGKITGVHKTERNPNEVDESIIQDIHSPFYGYSKSWLEPIEGKINKRYRKFL